MQEKHKTSISHSLHTKSDLVFRIMPAIMHAGDKKTTVRVQFLFAKQEKLSLKGRQLHK